MTTVELLLSVGLVVITGCGLVLVLVSVLQRKRPPGDEESRPEREDKAMATWWNCCGMLCCRRDSVIPANTDNNTDLQQNLLKKGSVKKLPQHYRAPNPTSNQRHNIEEESQTYYSSIAYVEPDESFSSERHYSEAHKRYSNHPAANPALKQSHFGKHSVKTHPVHHNPKSKLAPMAQPPPPPLGQGYLNIPKNAMDEQEIYANVSTEPGGNIHMGEYEFEVPGFSDQMPHSSEGHYEFAQSEPSTETVRYDVCGMNDRPIRSIDEEDDESGNEENYPYSYACVAKPEVGGGNSDYTEPATDENALYAQFKSLNVKIVKRERVGLGNYLGSGQFGTVYSGVWTVQDKETKVAVKTLNANAHTDDKVRFLQEAAIMGQFKHPNVVKMYGVVTEEEPFMIVLELLPKGDLRKHLDSLRPQNSDSEDLPHVLLRCCQQVAFGMSYLSRIGFVHRDLAARNILVAEDGTCKVADFGMSRDLAQEDYYISHGGQIPVKWTAPEAMHFRKYSTASDVWSFGVVMYEIWSLGHKPFEEYSNTKALTLIDRGFRLAPPPGCPKAIYTFMIECWNPESSLRPTFDKAVKYLTKSKASELLKWSVRDKAVHLSACKLGASLEVAENLHRELRERYLKNKST